MLSKLIEEKSKELADKHKKIIENECFLACEKYNCTLDDLIIKYHSNLSIEINVKVSHFQIVNHFTYDKGIMSKEAENIIKE